MVSCCILTYNDSDLIENCISAIYEFADEIVIIEGLWMSTKNRLDKKVIKKNKCWTDNIEIHIPDDIYKKYSGDRSSDGTIEIIQNYNDYDNKIKLVFANEKNRRYQYRVFFNVTKMETGDFMFIVTPDEIYNKQDLYEIKKYINYFDRLTRYEVKRINTKERDKKEEEEYDYYPRLFCIKEPKLFWQMKDIPNFAYRMKSVKLPISCFHYDNTRSEERNIFKWFYCKWKELNHIPVPDISHI